LIRINPLTYGVEALRDLLYPSRTPAFPLFSSLATLILFAGAMFGLSFLMVNRRTSKPAA
jgi:ABC-type polysaccharide/polyol phosphate export permease